MSINPITGKIDERREQLFIDTQYNIFILTGQPDLNGQRRGIAVKPFHQLSPFAKSHMTAQAKPLDASSRVSCAVINETLYLTDDVTGGLSTFPTQSLDADVQERLQRQQSGVWDKFMPQQGFGEPVALPAFSSQTLSLKPQRKI